MHPGLPNLEMNENDTLGNALLDELAQKAIKHWQQVLEACACFVCVLVFVLVLAFVFGCVFVFVFVLIVNC